MTQRYQSLWTDDDLLARLALHVKEAAKEDRAYAVVVCAPQRVIATNAQAIVEAAAGCLRKLLRDADLPGLLDGRILVAGLPDTDPDGVRVLCHRLKSDLGQRTSYLGAPVWLAGYACLYDDGATAEELLEAAQASTRSGHRHAV